MFTYILQGFTLMGGLIVSIGAQNYFILKQGLLRNHVLLVVLICLICDIVLSAVGIFGMGKIFIEQPILQVILAIAGGIFLFIYGLNAAINAYRGNTVLIVDNRDPKQSRLKIIIVTLMITLFNPHVYLDTVIILGGATANLLEPQKFYFYLGVIGASTVWFFGLGFGSRLLIPLFQKRKTWQLLDIFVTIVMWSISAVLFMDAYNLIIKIW